jgi:hypothetical protein
MGTTAIMGLRGVELVLVLGCVWITSGHASDDRALASQLQAVRAYAEACGFKVNEQRIMDVGGSDSSISSRVARAFGYSAAVPPGEADLAVVCSALLRNFGPDGVVARDVIKAPPELDRQMTGATESIPTALLPRHVKTVRVGADGKILSEGR